MMARGTSFIFSKHLLETRGSFNVLAVRFGVAFLILAVVGVGLLTVPGGKLSVGLLVALGRAVSYAATIIITDRLTDTPEEGLAIGVIQLGSLALLAGLASAIWQIPHLPATGSQWGMMAMLILVCTIFGFTFQPVAQSRVSAEITGLMAALNPAVAAVLGAVVLHEVFGWLGLLGIGLILVAIILPALPESREEPRDAPRA